MLIDNILNTVLILLDVLTPLALLWCLFKPTLWLVRIVLAVVAINFGLFYAPYIFSTLSVLPFVGTGVLAGVLFILSFRHRRVIYQRWFKLSLGAVGVVSLVYSIDLLLS
jgi:hypothetical protein